MGFELGVFCLAADRYANSPSLRCMQVIRISQLMARGCRAFAVKVEGKRLPVSTFSGFDLYHHFRNDAFYGLYNLLKVQKRENGKSFWDNLYRKRSSRVDIRLPSLTV